MSVAVFLLITGGSAVDLEVPSGEAQVRLDHVLRLIEDGRLEEARKVEAKIPGSGLNPFYWRNKLAKAYTAVAAWELAEAEYKALLELAPDDESVHCELGILYLKTGRTKEAEAELSQFTCAMEP